MGLREGEKRWRQRARGDVVKRGGAIRLSVSKTVFFISYEKRNVYPVKEKDKVGVKTGKG